MLKKKTWNTGELDFYKIDGDMPLLKNIQEQNDERIEQNSKRKKNN